MKRAINVITVAIGIVLVFCVMVTPTVAHEASQEGILDSYMGPYDRPVIGSESIGWAIDESRHLGTTELVYYFDMESDYTWRIVEAFEQGLQLWLDACPWLSATEITSEEAASYDGPVGEISVGMLGEHIFDIPDIIAVMNGPADDDGHYTSWSIYVDFNESNLSQFNDQVAAHEIGHVLGLTDLESLDNTERIMYYYAPGFAGFDDDGMAVLSQGEINGYSVISGQHVNHQFVSRGTYLQCEICDGIQTPHVHTIQSTCILDRHVGAKHTYKYLDTCTSCGHMSTRTVTRACSGPPCNMTQSVPDEEPVTE